MQRMSSSSINRICEELELPSPKLSPGFARIERDRVCSVPRRTGIETQASTNFLSYCQVNCPKRREFRSCTSSGVTEWESGFRFLDGWRILPFRSNPQKSRESRSHKLIAG